MADLALLDLAERVADAAREVARARFRQLTNADVKADGSPVTVADLEAEDAMRELLSREVPSHGILGEERGSAGRDSEYLWVLDPIDGTKQFLCGQPTFGVLVSLVHQGRPVIGILDQPILQERWVGADGARTRMNGVETSARPCARLADAISFTPSQNMHEHGAVDVREAIEKRVRFNRTGLECYAFGLLALGFVDLIVDSWMEAYDFCALVPIVEGAGGTITDWRGQPMGLDSHRSVAAGDARVHAEMLELLSQRGS